jgi:hypothetical protein
MPSIDLADVTLEQAFERIRSASGVRLVVDWATLEAAGISRSDPVSLRLTDVSAERATAEVLSLVGDGTVLLRAEDDDAGVIRVSTAEAFEPLPSRFYDIGDLLAAIRDLRNNGFPRPGGREGGRRPTEDELIRLIAENVEPDSWRDAGGSDGSIRLLWGRLVVTQTRTGHRALQKYLDALRAEFIGRRDSAGPAKSPSAPAPQAPRPAAE